jgi:hypothetical protein
LPYPGTFNPAGQPQAPEAKPFPWKWVIIGIFALIVIAGIIFLFSALKKAPADAEDDDNDFFTDDLTENLSTCQELSGTNCTPGLACNGTWFQALDSNTCCNGTCIEVIPDDDLDDQAIQDTINRSGPIFCEREAPPYFRYFEWVFFDDVGAIADNPNRKQISWTKETEDERKDYSEDYEIVAGETHYFMKSLALYDKKTNNTKSYMITVDENLEDVCTAGQLQYYKGLTEQIVYENEVTNITVNIGGKTCHMLKTPRQVSGGYRTWDCINKDFCEFMIETMGNTGEQIAAIKLEKTEIPPAVFAVPDICVGK